MFWSRLKNKKGNTLIGALIVMTALAATAAAVVYMSGSDSRSAVNTMQHKQADTIAHACLQWAFDKLNNGEAANVTDKEFAQGTFTATTDPDASLITCKAQVGETVVTLNSTAYFSSNCVDLIVSNAYTEDNVIRDIQLVKKCNDSAILSKLYMTWNVSDCALHLNCDGSETIDDINDVQDEAEYEDVGEAPNGKFWICHVPPGNPDNAQTLAVNINGWLNGHKAGKGNSHNSDYLGPCLASQVSDSDNSGVEEEESTEENTETCESTASGEQAVTNCDTSDGDLQITKVVITGGTVLFEEGTTPGTDTVATNSGEVTDINDAVLSANGTYTIDIHFNSALPVGMWASIITEFVDYSDLYGLMKLGNIPAEVTETTNDDSFDVVDGGVVVVDADTTIDIQALGSAITCGSGGPNIPVRAKLCINNNCGELWDYNTIEGTESYSTTNSTSGAEYVIEANAALSSCGNYSATYNSKDQAGTQVRVLTDGQQAPPLEGFGGQKDVTEYLADYLDSQGRVVLDANQVIYLFELGVNVVSNPDSTSADFQDLVILMTITDN
jgi:hypothetical protein